MANRIILIVSVILLASLGFVYYNSNQTSTYTSKYGFTFSYSSNWRVKSKPDLYIAPKTLQSVVLETADEKHLINFSTLKIADLKAASESCPDFGYTYSYDNQQKKWKRTADQPGNDCQGNPAIPVSFVDSNMTIGDGLKALIADTEINPVDILLPLNNGYGLLITVVNRSPDGGLGVDPIAQPILSSIRRKS